jgi:DNA-binding NtrC family response regulator
LIGVRDIATIANRLFRHCAELRESDTMEHSLSGQSILIIEDQALIALDIQQALEDQGAKTTTVRTIAAALLAIEDPAISATIVDHALGDGDGSVLCQRLKDRGVPFITYSGHANLAGACAGARHLTKPTSEALLVSTLKDVLALRQMPSEAPPL